jgi:hypothetical protein
VIELRIPWGLLNVCDPSSHRVLHQVGARGDELGTAVTDGIRLYAFTPERRFDPVTFTWPGWDEPRYTLELKAGVSALRAAMRSLEPLR